MTNTSASNARPSLVTTLARRPPDSRQLHDLGVLLHVGAKLRGRFGQRSRHRPRGYVAAHAFEDVAGIHIGKLGKPAPQVARVQPPRLIAKLAQPLIAVDQGRVVGLGLQAEGALLLIEAGSRPAVEFLPELHGAGNHLGVQRLPPILVSHHAGFVGGGCSHVGRAVLVKQRHALACPAEPVRRGADHDARTHDHNVVHVYQHPVGACRSVSPKPSTKSGQHQVMRGAPLPFSSLGLDEMHRAPLPGVSPGWPSDARRRYLQLNR